MNSTVNNVYCTSKTFLQFYEKQFQTKATKTQPKIFK